jgi:diguanylate cyclase (GGDEF)-like protein
MTPVRLVVLPLAVLSLVFALILLVVMASDQILLVSPAPLLIAGALLYASTMVILGLYGFASVRELESLGATDSLSQLPNRRALHQAITKASKGHREVAVALIDLDSFKQVNDQYGHAAGDELIQQCAQILRQIYEPEARCFRLGGDEFAIVMAGKAAGTILEGLCRALLERLSRPLMLGERHVNVGASIGLVRSTGEDRLPSSELLRRSDVAMYMSKRGGKMRCTWYNRAFDLRREAARELEDDIHKGLVGHEFTLVYQPLVDARTGAIVAVEALMRWHRADGRKIGPATFIPVAEASGLINQIGHLALRQAVSDALGWHDVTLSVNISAEQLRNPAFPIQLGDLLEQTGFPPHRLELEITETGLVLDPEVAERTLDLIRRFGVKIVLDDFGTGYASIGFLRQFRFEKLKLDRSLVVDAGTNDGSRAMMVSSIALARALKMAVTAEGVETAEQAEFVRAAGCDQVQGWLYYKAMPASEIEELILAQSTAQRARSDTPPATISGTAS